MRSVMRSSVFGVLSWFALCTSVVSAQQPPLTTRGFASADLSGKRQILDPIIRHESSINGEAVVALIRAGIEDQDSNVRELALTAIVSRAAGPRFVPTGAVITDWRLDHEAIRA